MSTFKSGSHMRPSPLSRILVASILGCTLLASCQSPPKLSDEVRVGSSEEVANVFVSAYPAVPWAAISDKLEPKNNLSTADARALAAVTTQSQVNQFLSTFAAGLAVGLPTRTSSSSTTIAANGVATTSGSRSVSPGTVPSASGASGVALTDSNLAPDLSKGPFANGVDATTQLMVGTAVYQLAQILDNQISKALPLRGYQGHLVTLQVNLQPRLRNLPYDAYINITLLPASWAKAITTSDRMESNADELSPVIVYPLVIADAMETSTVGRSVEVLRQAALSISGIVGNAGVSGGLSGGSDGLSTILGSDRNSLVTVGRISDNSLRVRLGAQQQGSRSLALVPRTQNISVVVFTRSGETPALHLDKLAVITETSFVDAARGIALPSGRLTAAGRVTLGERVTKTVMDYGFALNPACSQDGGLAVDLLRSLDRQDYGYVSKCILSARTEAPAGAPRRVLAELRTPTPGSDQPAPVTASLYSLSGVTGSADGSISPPAPTAGIAPVEEARLRRLVASLMSLQSDARNSKLMIPLEPFKSKTMKFPETNQLVLMSDDKSGAKVILRGGENLEAEKLKVRLTFKQNNADRDSVVLLPTSVDVDATGATITASFPSIVAGKLLAPAKATPAKAGKGPLADPVVLSVAYSGTDAKEPAAFKGPSTYKIVVQEADAEPLANPVSVTSSVLIMDDAGNGKLTLNVGAWDAGKQGALAIRVSGADVRAIEPNVSVDAKRKAVPLSGSSVVTLTLGNLSSAQVVQFKTLASDKVIGNPITLSVEPARTASR